MPLEVLHGAFMLFRRCARLEGTEIPPLAGLRIYLAGIEPVLAGLQFSDHDVSPSFSELFRSMAGQPSCSRPDSYVFAIAGEHGHDERYLVRSTNSSPRCRACP